MVASNTVVFDIDDTTGSLKKELVKLLRTELSNPSICYSEWTQQSVEQLYNVSWEQMRGFMLNHRVMELMEPHEGAPEAIQSLRANGYRVEFVTARGWREDAYEVTKTWLDKNDIPYDGINIVHLHECKEQVTRHIDNICCFVDDRVDHCLAMSLSGRVKHSIVYSQPWNDQYRGSLQKVNSFADILKVLQT